MYFEHILKCLCFVFLLKLVQCRQCRGKYKLKNGRNIRFFAQRRYIWHIRNHTVLSSGVLSESNEFWLTSFFMLYHNVRQEQNAFVISFIRLFFFMVLGQTLHIISDVTKRKVTSCTTWEVYTLYFIVI